MSKAFGFFSSVDPIEVLFCHFVLYQKHKNHSSKQVPAESHSDFNPVDFYSNFCGISKNSVQITITELNDCDKSLKMFP